MSKQEREKLWMAYLDGQMSAAEASEFDESLSAEERDQMAAEMRMEAGIAEQLSSPACCPDEVWEALRSQIGGDEARSNIIRFPMRVAGIFSAVAAAAIVVYALVGVQSDGLESGSFDKTVTVAELEKMSHGISAEDYFKSHEIHLAMATESTIASATHHGSVRLIGACDGDCPYGSLAEILFECCGEPVRVVLAEVGSRGERMLQQAAASGKVQETRMIGGYLAGVVGIHHAPELLDLIKPEPVQLT